MFIESKFLNVPNLGSSNNERITLNDNSAMSLELSIMENAM